MPRRWFAGRQVFILGGSPWLQPAHAELIRGKGAVIAVNNAHQLAPWADAFYWADRTWLQWNRDRLAATLAKGTGAELITRIDPCDAKARSWPIRILRHDQNSALSREADALAGWCSGANALNLAYLGGPERVTLMGFEGRRSGNWHKQHLSMTAPSTYERYIVPAFTRMAAELKAEGLPVFNCTPDSALSCFPHAPLGEFL